MCSALEFCICSYSTNGDIWHTPYIFSCDNSSDRKRGVECIGMFVWPGAAWVPCWEAGQIPGRHLMGPWLIWPRSEQLNVFSVFMVLKQLMFHPNFIWGSQNQGLICGLQAVPCRQCLACSPSMSSHVDYTPGSVRSRSTALPPYLMHC